MKERLSIFFLIILIFSFTACGASEEAEEEITVPQTPGSEISTPEPSVVPATKEELAESSSTETNMWLEYAKIAQAYYDRQNEIFEARDSEDKADLNPEYFVASGSYLAEVTEPTFMVYDLNGDGTEEFFIARYHSDMDEHTIYDVYTWQNNCVHRLVGDIGYRNGTCDIQEDGIVLSRYSGSAHDFGVDVLILPEGGTSFERISKVFANRIQVGESYSSEYFRRIGTDSKPEKITEEGYLAFLEQYHPQELSFVANTPKTIKKLGAGEYEEGTPIEDVVPQQGNPTAAELFTAVLQNEREIRFSELGAHGRTDLFSPKIGTISELQYGYESHYDIANFAVVDMDGNGISEVILEVEEYFGYIILCYQDGRIIGHGMPYRGFMNLREEGLYESTGGAAYGKINRLYFLGKTWEQDVLAEMDYQSYYRKDMVCDEAVWKQECEEFNKKDSAEWYAFTPENIATYVLENEELTIKYSDLPQNVRNRQEYLDSLSYLQELTYDLYQKSEEKYKEDAKAYYNACQKEMEKILNQCIEKEGPRGEAELEKEQQLWQENFDRRRQETLSIYRCDSMEELLNTNDRYLYFSYGDMMLRRTLRLLDRYFECNEYEQ